MSDLETWCDRQLPNIGEVVEEIIGANREEIKLTTKVLPRRKKFIGTTCGVSTDVNGRENESVWGTGKGFFSEIVHRDVPCFSFKEIEKNDWE